MSMESYDYKFKNFVDNLVHKKKILSKEYSLKNIIRKLIK